MKSIRNSQEPVWSIAHRGARKEAPENTDAAFRRALDYPIDGIELDVQMSADGVAVIYHDRTLFRVAGRRKAVSECDYAYLKQLGWNNHLDRGFQREPLPTLEQVLERYGGRTRLLIEIKSHPAEQVSGHTDRLTREVLRLLDRYDRLLPDGRIFLLSFDNRVLQLAHRLDPRWLCVLNLPDNKTHDLVSIFSSRAGSAPVDGTDHLWAVDVAIGRLSAEWIDWARGLGLRVFTYTCNGPRQLRKALNLGVDGIISDRPGWLTQQLKHT